MDKNFHTVLALKYRPQKFEDLIGQDMMVQTISNAIKFNKLPNAYLLTGIRGVGKTTTARIIAKALNCKKNFIQNEKCKEGESCHCKLIAQSNHLDVLEMDAASRTGIDDIRELIESSQYNPTNASYKIFIIDEVHMLSKQAFNGLLKTLEEPPKHLKFIFATTEVHKIPITIISRCQRFDLRRISQELLVDNLKKISEIEKGKISEKALHLIAKAANGSVRDSLSLLDKTLISQKTDNTEIDEKFVQKILGLADKSKIIGLFQLILEGNHEQSIINIQSLTDEGIDAKLFLNEFLEIIFLISSIKKLKLTNSDYFLNEEDFNFLKSISNSIDLTTLFIFWQFTLNTIKELQMVNNQSIALKIFILRLIHLKDMPNLENLIDRDNETSEEDKNNLIDDFALEPSKQKGKFESNDQIKNIIQTKPENILKNEPEKAFTNNLEIIKNFSELIELASIKKEAQLKYDLEKNVNLIKFLPGKIDIGLNDNLNENFIRKLSEKLLEWTGNRWIISLSREQGEKSMHDKKEEKLKNIIKDIKKTELYKNFTKNFPDGELIEIKKED